MRRVIEFVANEHSSKGELADKNIKASSIEYDCAIPQQWVEKVRERFTAKELESLGNIASHFVYVYDNYGEHRTEYIMPLTKTGCAILGRLAVFI